MKKFVVVLILIFTGFSMQAQLPIDWVGDSDIETFQEASIVHAGSSSCGIIVNTGTQANCDLDNAVAIPVTAGETFKMSFWGYTSEFVRGRAKVIWSDNTTVYATTYLGPNTGGWEQFSFEGEVPADITSVIIGVRFYDVSGFTPGETQYLDDFVFESPIGNPLTVSNGDFESWPGLDPEPDNYPTDFSAEVLGLGVTLSWADAVGAQLPSGYLIKASTEDNITLPEDGIFVNDDLDLSDGSGAANVAYGSESFGFSNLEGATTYYFKIFPYSNGGANIDYKTDGTPPAAEAQTSDVVVIEAQNFDASFGTWTRVSVIGEQEWDNDNNYGPDGSPCAKMTGFAGGANANEDWLISPAMNFNNFENESFSFYSAVGYITANEVFGVRISTDYDGGADPNTSTWTDLEPVLPDGVNFFEWTYSEAMDISAFDGENVRVAFVYYSDDVDASTWEVDNVTITGEGQYVPNPEPSNYPTSFAAMAQGQDIDISWTDATGDQLPAGYLVFGSDSGNFDLPVDGTPLTDDPDLSDGTGVLNVAFGSQGCSFDDLPGNETFYFTIFPYTNAGTYIDYKTDGSAPEAEATTVELTSLLFTDFNDDWGGWTTISVVGDQTWSRDNTYGLESTPCALMSGYESGNFENEDWLISPALDFSTTVNEALSFFSAMNYSGPQLELRVSTDYDGSGNPNDFTWTTLTDEVNWSGGAFEWEESGMISLSQFSGNSAVYIGYQFFSTAENSSNWELDNIEVTEAQLVGEPSNYPAMFAAAADMQTITLTWDDATGEILPDAYLIKANTLNIIVPPVDGVPIPDDDDLSDGTAFMNIPYGTETLSFSGLEEEDTYFFKIYPYTNSGSLIDYKTDGTAPAASATTEVDPYTDLLFTTFDQNWENWEQISVTGDQVWDRDNTYGIEDTPCAKMSGYSGQSYANEDWLISPDIDLGGYFVDEQLIFYSASAYTGLPLQVFIADDYVNDPSTATWVDLSDQVTWPEEGSFFEWTNSGVIDISGWGDASVNIAFVYQSTDETSATWEIDNVLVQAINTVGVDEKHAANQLSIYPNPGNGIFNIESSNTIKTIEVYSITGALVAQQNPEALSTQINLSDLIQGMYFARIIDNKGNIITNKIVIE